MPSCAPVSSMTRTSRTLIRSLTRVRSSRRGPLSKAISYLRSSSAQPSLLPACTSAELAVRRRTSSSGSARPDRPPPGFGRRPCRLCRLAVANHQHVWDLLQLGFANLISDLLLPLVELDPEPGRRQAVPDRPRVVGVAVGDRQDGHLHRRQPERERSGVVLDQQRDEALETAENGPVDDDRPVLGVVGADVFQVEALGHLVVELDRRALPLRPMASVTSKSIFGP